MRRPHRSRALEVVHRPDPDPTLAAAGDDAVLVKRDARHAPRVALERRDASAGRVAPDTHRLPVAANDFPLVELQAQRVWIPDLLVLLGGVLQKSQGSGYEE